MKHTRADGAKQTKQKCLRHEIGLMHPLSRLPSCLQGRAAIHTAAAAIEQRWNPFTSPRKVWTVTAIGIVSAAAYAIGIAVAIGLGSMISAASVRPAPRPDSSPSAGAFDPSPFLLNALLVPALDADAMPLRFVDPRAASRCGPGTQVRVNGEPLQPGALVPDAPFNLEWRADGCQPMGANGPRYDGTVSLIVFREDWGFSAMVRPAGLAVSYEGTTTPVAQGATWYPRCNNAGRPVRAGSFAAVRAPRCS